MRLLEDSSGTLATGRHIIRLLSLLLLSYHILSDAEIACCSTLFDEEIAVNERITAEGMRSCLLAMGEFVRIKTIMK